MNHGESQEEFKEMLSKHKVPVKKQRVILKPKKLKLPERVDLLDEENFSDVIYDSDKDNKVKKDKKWVQSEFETLKFHKK